MSTEVQMTLILQANSTPSDATATAGVDAVADHGGAPRGAAASLVGADRR